VTISVKPVQIAKKSFQSGFQSYDKEYQRPKDGRAFFHTSATILLSAHPYVLITNQHSHDYQLSSSVIKVIGIHTMHNNYLSLRVLISLCIYDK